LTISLYEAVSSAPSANKESSSQAFWNQINSPNIASSTRFALTTSLLERENSILIKDGILDEIAEEAVQAALTGDNAAKALAIACIGKKSRWTCQLLLILDQTVYLRTRFILY
jgi:hypothetical protein